MRWAKAIAGFARVLVSNLIRLLTVLFRSRTSLIAENLFLRKQLAFYQEHKLKPQPVTDAARWTLVLCSRRFEWGSALVMVKPDTLIGWHRKGFKWFWRCKACSGRPPLQDEIRELIVRMAKENPTGARGGWLRSAILNRAFWCALEPCESTGPGDEMTGVAKQVRPSAGRASSATTPDAMVACDFMVAVTAKFQLLYVFVMLELGISTYPAVQRNGPPLR